MRTAADLTPVADLEPVRQYLTRTAKQLAKAITANCDALTLGSIDQGTWSAEQDRLWRLADEHRISNAVRHMVAPGSFPTVRAI